MEDFDLSAEMLQMVDDIIEGKIDNEMLDSRLESMDFKNLAYFMRALEARHDAFKTTATKLYKVMQFMTEAIVPDKLDEDGIHNITISGVGRWQTSAQIQCSMKKGMQPKLREWLEEHDSSSLITETVNSSTLKAFIKEQQKKGNPIPGDDMLNLRFYTKASLIKS